MVNIFVSHTKKDIDFCDEFDKVCARVGVKAFRSEFEDIELPAWRTIRDEINKSSAIFFLVGKELYKSQRRKTIDPNWIFTQNWIAYEIGVACQKKIDVWAICDNVLINFPMPYINNYLTVSLKQKDAFRYIRSVLEDYSSGIDYKFPYVDSRKYGYGVTCPQEDCKAEFNLHVKLQPNSGIVCPQCLKTMYFTEGFNL